MSFWCWSFPWLRLEKKFRITTKKGFIAEFDNIFILHIVCKKTHNFIYSIFFINKNEQYIIFLNIFSCYLQVIKRVNVFCYI